MGKVHLFEFKEVPDAIIKCEEAPDQSVVSQQYSHSQFDLGKVIAETRERNISSNIVRSWNVYNICGELRDEIQLTDLPWRTLVNFFALKAHNKEFTVVGTVRLSDEVSFLEKKANAAQSPQLGEVHLLWNNQSVHMKSKRGRRCSLLGLAVTGGPVVIIWWTVPCDADLEIKEGLLRSGYSDKMFLKLMFASTVRIEGCTIFEKHKK
ncbi:hypothetical protein TNCV_2444141 [Trichonephila clavipes]|nr:hypothetical protein TNCV_2444141 [Trichonephila clavipes]